MRRFARGETLKTYSIASSLHSAASLHVSFFALWVCLNEHIGGTLRAGGPEATVSTGSWKFDFFADSSSLIGSSSVDSFITKVDVVLVVDVEYGGLCSIRGQHAQVTRHIESLLGPHVK